MIQLEMQKPFALALVLSTFCGVASIVLWSKVLDLLTKLNSFMQRQAADLSSIEKELGWEGGGGGGVKSGRRSSGCLIEIMNIEALRCNIEDFFTIKTVSSGEHDQGISHSFPLPPTKNMFIFLACFG